MKWGARVLMALKAFREAYLASDSAHELDFESFDARCMRYALYWAMFESNIYQRVNTWSTGYKHTYSLSKHIRSIYNPANRLGNFYAVHLFGGALDLEAGPTGAIPIAIPSEGIESENEQLRASITTLWVKSNFASLKDVITLRGAVEGDVFLRVVDDTEKEVVFIERVNPSIVADLTKDPLGNIKGYVIEEKRPDPHNKARMVAYREEVSRDGENVVYETFLNGKPYAWGDQPATWSVPYTFVPAVHWAHNEVGLEYGWSELHPVRAKIDEANDLASMISDQIGKYVNPDLLVAGVDNPGDLQVTGATRNETGGANTRPDPGREEIKIICAPAGTTVEPMLADLNLKDALQHLDNLLEELERDCPELQADIWATGATSGRALRVARQRVESKIQQRRENYDAGLVRLQKMAIAIGGYRNYKGYEGFGLESYAQGKLDHSIAPRPVFTPDPMDSVEIAQALWSAAKVAVEAGADLAGFLMSQGMDEETIAGLIQSSQGEQDEEV